MEYFVYTDRQEGPFSLEQMQSKKLTMGTPVWHTGLTEWTTAGNVAELVQRIKSTPPPFPAVPVSEYEYQVQMEEFFAEKKKTDWVTVAWVVFSVCCVLLLFWVMN